MTLYDLLRVMNPHDDVDVMFWRRPGKKLPTYHVSQLIQEDRFEPELLNATVIALDPRNWHTVGVMIQLEVEQ